MTKHLRLIGIALGILGMQFCFSQENFLPGYIVTLKGDSTHGLIDYRNWERNPDKITFQDKIDGNKINYSPIEIRSFSVYDEIYLSAIVETEVSPYKSSALEFSPELQIVVDTVFLQTMIKGIISLYYYKDSYGKDNFYIKQNEGFDLLVYKKYMKIHEGASVVLENKKYTGQLTVYLQDCKEILSKVYSTDYRKNSLEKLFLSFYKCTNPEIDFQKKTEKIKLEIGVLAGISISSLKFIGDDFPQLVNGNYSKSKNFTAGLFFDLLLPRAQRKWSINNELIFTSYSMEDHYNYYRGWASQAYYDTKLEYSYLKMNNMIRYKHPLGNFFIFVNVGMSSGYAISETNYQKNVIIGSTEKIKEGKCIPETTRFEQGYLLGLGVKYKKFSFEMRFEKGTGISAYYLLNVISKRNYFLLGYRF